MKFYNRTLEIQTLRQLQKKAAKQAQMTFIVGRRRIGKTKLILEAYQNTSFVYFFVSKKSEALLCKEFCDQLKAVLPDQVHGIFEEFEQLFAYLLALSMHQTFTLVIDEFQTFYQVNPSVYASIQKLWDQHKTKSRLNLIFSGSVYTLMHKIFEQAKEPLYGRATHKIKLEPFTPLVLENIFEDYQMKQHADDMLAFYMVTGGVPKYVEILVDHQALTFEKILAVFFEQNSIFVHEGRDLLIEEFGKDHGTYFSILSLIASSKTSRSEMESILNKSIGGYLERLETDYGLIRAIKPLFAKPGTKTRKYTIQDNFLHFWFRFCYKNQSAIEMGNIPYIKQMVKTAYPTYSGPLLEKYFIEKMKCSQQFNLIGQYWDMKNQNEIDLIALNEHQKYAVIAEIKRNSKRIDLHQLKLKAADFIKKHLPGYRIQFKGLGLENLFDDC